MFDNIPYDTIQSVADVLAGIFGTAGTVVDWIVNIGGTLIGWLISGIQFLVNTVGGWIA